MATIVRMGHARGSDVEKMIGQGVLAKSRVGGSIDGDTPWLVVRPVGLGIEGLHGIVERGGHVIVVVAGSRERVAPLRVASETGLVNVLFTDDAMAGELQT